MLFEINTPIWIYKKNNWRVICCTRSRLDKFSLIRQYLEIQKHNTIVCGELGSALFYAMYLIAWRICEKKDQIYKITLLITIIGFVNVPIIKYSVDWWNTLHQPASINLLTKSSIHTSMLFPLIIMNAAFALFSLLIFLMKYNTELIKIKNKGLDRI